MLCAVCSLLAAECLSLAVFSALSPGAACCVQCVVCLLLSVCPWLCSLCSAPEQRARLRPALVYQEIVSYLKGSVEAVMSPGGRLSTEAYTAIGEGGGGSLPGSGGGTLSD